ncbi:hypothetical protein AAFF_G00058430 [Aldrovandia affinis]|uniref:Uncharacterized protein n=1 Tax=Aldrovandia affinis TaxID=143900 RepID=A0AAD7S086_9TELE|nr:hypothetical protein AAFF_G00058430 [Aldrovandia affinis]
MATDLLSVVRSKLCIRHPLHLLVFLRRCTFHLMRETGVLVEEATRFIVRRRVGGGERPRRVSRSKPQQLGHTLLLPHRQGKAGQVRPTSLTAPLATDYVSPPPDVPLPALPPAPGRLQGPETLNAIDSPPHFRLWNIKPSSARWRKIPVMLLSGHPLPPTLRLRMSPRTPVPGRHPSDRKQAGVAAEKAQNRPHTYADKSISSVPAREGGLKRFLWLTRARLLAGGERVNGVK